MCRWCYYFIIKIYTYKYISNITKKQQKISLRDLLVREDFNTYE